MTQAYYWVTLTFNKLIFFYLCFSTWFVTCYLIFLHVLLPWQHTGISQILPFLSCISPCLSCHREKIGYLTTNKRKHVYSKQKDHPTMSEYKFNLTFSDSGIVATVNYYKFYWILFRIKNFNINSHFFLYSLYTHTHSHIRGHMDTHRHTHVHEHKQVWMHKPAHTHSHMYSHMSSSYLPSHLH